MAVLPEFGQPQVSLPTLGLIESVVAPLIALETPLDQLLVLYRRPPSRIVAGRAKTRSTADKTSKMTAGSCTSQLKI
jgi:hypothetical protein